MARVRFLMLLLTLCGCTRNKTFVNVGHDTAVPGASVEAYARKHNVTEAEALKQLLTKDDAQSRPAATQTPPSNTEKPLNSKL